ncbi:MAG: hypothetical protein R3C18_15880 [Planctomycetaceae bacterium]
MNPSKVRWILVVFVILAVAASPFLVRGNQAVESLKKVHQEEIASLSESDRARIVERNFETFTSLPEAERNAYISLHTRLVEDKKKTGHLSATLDTYSSWLRTLEPYQREELKQESDPGKRVELIKEFLHEQSEEAARNAVANQMESVSGPPQGGGRGGWRTPPLPPEALARIMEEIEAIMFHRLDTGQRSELEHLEGLARYVRLLHFVREESVKRDDGRLFSMRDETELQKVISVIEDSRIRESLGEAGTPFQRMRWHILLHFSLRNELEKETRAERRLPSADTLEADFNALPKDMQDKLLSLSSDDFIDELTRLNEERNAPVTREDVEAVFSIPESFRKRYAEAAGQRFNRDGGPGRPRPEDIIRNADRNKNGRITFDELPEEMKAPLSRFFEEAGEDGLPVEGVIERFDRLRSNGGRFGPRGGEGGPRGEGGPPFGPPPDRPGFNGNPDGFRGRPDRGPGPPPGGDQPPPPPPNAE